MEKPCKILLGKNNVLYAANADVFQYFNLIKSDKDTLIASIKQADRECGSCGCELDPLYKRALVLLNK